MANDDPQTPVPVKYSDLTFRTQFRQNWRRIVRGADLWAAVAVSASGLKLAPGLADHLEAGTSVAVTVLAAALAAMALATALTNPTFLALEKARRAVSTILFFYWWVAVVSAFAALFCWLSAAYRDGVSPCASLPVWTACTAIFLVSYSLFATASLAGVTWRLLHIYRELLSTDEGTTPTSRQ
jgi:hypothetical protein